MQYKDLIIPTINVNDTKVTISGIKKKNLDYIEAGEVLYSVETSKAVEDYYVDTSGYVVLFVKDFDEVEVGKSAGMIFKSLDDAIEKNKSILAQETNEKKLMSIRASKKAIMYAEEIGFDLTLIQKDGLIKTEDIDNYINSHKK